MCKIPYFYLNLCLLSIKGAMKTIELIFYIYPFFLLDGFFRALFVSGAYGSRWIV